MYPSAVFQLIIAMGLGTIVSRLLSLTGMTFPVYIGAMIVAAFIRNIGEYSGKFTDLHGRDQRYRRHQSVPVPRYRHDHPEALAAGGSWPCLFWCFWLVRPCCSLSTRTLLCSVSWEAITTLPSFLPESVALEWERRPTPWQTCRCSVKNMRPPSRLTFWCRWWAAFSQTSSTAWRSLFLSTLYNKKRMSGCGHSREDLCFLKKEKREGKNFLQDRKRKSRCPRGSYRRGSRGKNRSRSRKKTSLMRMWRFRKSTFIERKNKISEVTGRSGENPSPDGFREVSDRQRFRACAF